MELDLAIKSLASNNTSGDDKVEIIDHIESLRSEKYKMVEERGERLAERLGTKWYNEGEKSSRYFLRILQRSNPDNFKQITNKEGEVLTGAEQIEEEIVNFYKELYEK